MADKSFGIKELNLVSSGAPKIESSGNLNLNAVTVAISTNATVGGNLEVDGSKLTVTGGVVASGISTFAGITTVTGQTLFTKQLGVSGFSTFFNDVKFTGASYDALWDTSENRLEFKDGASAVFGTGNDLEIKHSGGNTSLKNITGEFRIAGNDIRIQNQTSSTDFIKVNSTGSVVTGILTATSFSGDGSALTGITGTTINNNANNRVITGSGTANTLEAESSLTYDGTTLTATSFSGSGNDIVTSRWTLGSNGSNYYTFTGPGGLSNASQPKIYLARGQTYEFVNNSGGSHPFQIQTGGGAAYNTGVTNNNASSGTIKFEVPFSAPNSLQYVCTNHGGMGNTIIIYPDLSP